MTTPSSITLSVVIPVFNEERMLAQLVIAGHFREQFVSSNHRDPSESVFHYCNHANCVTESRIQ